MGTKDVRRRLMENNPKPVKEPVPKFNSIYLRGVGSAIQYITTHEYFASGCNGCHTTAREMDKLAPDDILARIDEFAEKLHQNSQGQRWSKLLDWFAYNIYGLEKHKELIRRAVTLHIEEAAKKAHYTP